MEGFGLLLVAWLLFFSGELAHEAKAAWLRHQYHYAK